MTKLAIALGVLCGVSGVALADGPSGPPGGGPVAGAPDAEPALRPSGEVIEIHGHNPLQVPSPKTDPGTIPPYSDAAVLGDYWSRAWMLLEVDERGVVARVKFLKRPGHDLDAIAVKFAFNLRFDPARDDSGVPKRSYVVWPLEWPSVGWLQSRDLLMNRLPPFADVVQISHGDPVGNSQLERLSDSGVVFDSLPACSNGRGVTLDEIHPVQRDCSLPDLTVAAREPWLARGLDMPAPAVEAAPIIDPAVYHADQVASAQRQRTAAMATAVAASALAVATVLAYGEMHKYSDRVETDEADRLVTTPAQLAADRSKYGRWEAATIAVGVGALISGVASAHLWRSESQLVLQPTGDGAALSYGGRF